MLDKRQVRSLLRTFVFISHFFQSLKPKPQIYFPKWKFFGQHEDFENSVTLFSLRLRLPLSNYFKAAINLTLYVPFIILQCIDDQRDGQFL